MPALPAAGVGGGKYVSAGRAWEPIPDCSPRPGDSESLWGTARLPLQFPAGAATEVCNGSSLGKAGPREEEHLLWDTGQRTGGGVQATYLRSKRNVHSLAQPTMETSWERVSPTSQSSSEFFPPTGISSPNSSLHGPLLPLQGIGTAPASQMISSSPETSSGKGRGGRHPTALPPAREGALLDGHTLSSRGTSGGHPVLVGSQGLAGNSRDFTQHCPTTLPRGHGAHPVPSGRGVRCPGS